MFTTFFSNAVLEIKENGQFIILQNDNERSQAPSNCQTLPLFKKEDAKMMGARAMKWG